LWVGEGTGSDDFGEAISRNLWEERPLAQDRRVMGSPGEGGEVGRNSIVGILLSAILMRIGSLPISDHETAMNTITELVSPLEDSWMALARLDELQGDGPFALSAAGLDLVVVRAGGGLKAYQGRCPHQGALLGEGEMDGGMLVCRNHRWRFETLTGQRVGGSQCLTTCPTEIREGMVWVDLDRLRSGVAGELTPEPRTLDDLPGPKGLPLVGNLLQLEPSRLHEILEGWAAQYGPMFVYRMGPQRILVVSEPEVAARVLRERPETFRRTANLAPIFDEMGVSGVFSAEGSAWRPQRRLAMEALSHRHLKGFYPTLQMVAGRLRDRWLASARAGRVLDVADEMKRFTVDVTTLLVFGYDADTIGKTDDVIQRKLEHVFPAFNRRLFALLPTWRWLRMPADRRLDAALGELQAWLGGLIQQARANLAADPERAGHPTNFIESMLSARDADGQPFSEDAIFGNAMTMLLAGEDTTAYTLAWAVHHLSDAPEAVARLRAEAAALVVPDSIAPDIAAADGLTYAGGVANESMRLRPVAPVILLQANHPTVVGEVAIDSGTWVAILTRPPAVHERYFADPSDFRPERWLDGGQRGAHDPAAHIPFGSGPRICPGRSLALVEMKTVLAMLYGNFEVERVGDPAEVGERLAFTMSPTGLKVRLRERP
jgi:cytochrome P450/nitrite reductase/ring-hydroxylating ferredoxin subunit